MELTDRFSYLFGTEEYVGMRRQLVFLREELMKKLCSNRKSTFICSGSLGEGVAYPVSDDDIMVFDKGSCVVQTHGEATKRGRLLMVSSENSPGYCLLQDVQQSFPSNLIYDINGLKCVSSSLWKNAGQIRGQDIHGPCLSQKFTYYEYDLALCLPCSFWPHVASDWAERNRPHGWPTPEMIQDILDRGCHVVPLGAKESAFTMHEWRLSFSLAERMLMHSFSHFQFVIYNLLRLILKKAIHSNVERKQENKKNSVQLCSYFMKTSLFYNAEKKSAQMWKETKFEICLKSCLSLIYEYVSNGIFPNYFIPEHNMIKGKFDHDEIHRLSFVIRAVDKKGIVSIINLCGESRCLEGSLSLQSIEWKQDTDFMFSFLVESTTSYLMRILCNPSDREIKSCTILINKIMSLLQCDSSDMKNSFLFRRGIIYCGQKIINRILSIPRKKNKINYNVHKKIIECFLKIGYRTDLTTGKLTMATYKYMVRETEFAISHLQQLLSEFPSYAIVRPKISTERTYIDVLCNRGYTIGYKIQRSWAPHYQMNKILQNCYPSPLRLWINIMGTINLHPLSYAYVLECLCHFRLMNHVQFIESRKNLEQHLKILKDLYADCDVADARMCFGIIKYEQGDRKSACKWFGKAAVGKLPSPYKEKTLHAASTYIAFLLHKQLRPIFSVSSSSQYIPKSRSFKEIFETLTFSSTWRSKTLPQRDHYI